MSMVQLLEAAVRTLIMGALIGSAMRALRLKQIRARRAAWLLALGGALLMPLLVAWELGPRVLPALHDVIPAPAAGVAAPLIVDAMEVPLGYASDEPMHAEVASSAAGAAERQIPFMTYAAWIYLAVAGVFALRLGVGASIALRIRRRARRIEVALGTGLDVRVSERVSAPVTIASSIVLPNSHASWRPETLRIILSHEGAHVRHRDFYVQLLAGLHCTLFWFSPFSWWLRRELADLAEAMSDHAAVQHAASRASYAEILLAFASRSEPAAAVAMARASNLTSRIERLLSEQGFQQCFGGRRRAVLLAAIVAATALAVATSATRVHADAVYAFNASGSDPSARSAAASAVDAAQPARSDSGVSEPPPSAPAPPAPPAPAVPRTPAMPAIPPMPAMPAMPAVPPADGTLPSVHGDTIYYQYNGRRYRVRIPSLTDHGDELLAPVHELERAQQDLARESAELAREQVEMNPELAHSTLATPDFRRDIADLDQVVKQMKLAETAPQIRPESLAQLQDKLAGIQARLAMAQRQANRSLGDQQRRLGREMGRMSEQRRRYIDQTMQQLRPLLEKAIRDGLATPVG